MLPDFKADLLVPQVRLDAKADFLQTRLEIPHVIALGIGDIEDHRLLGREPQRHGPGVVLDEDAEEALEGAEDRPMEHHRGLACAVLVDELGTQATRQVEVQLQGTALPDAVEAVAQGEFDLGAVEGALAGLQLPLQAGGVKRRLEARLGAIPHLGLAEEVIGTGGELELHVVEAELLVDLEGQGDEVLGLRLYLLLGAEDMGVVLGEGAHPHQAVQRAGGLVAVAAAELRQAQRQVPVALQPLVEHLHVAGAVHRLHRIVALLRLGGEHQVAVVTPVTGLLPQREVHHLGRLDLLVAVLDLHPAHVLLQGLVHGPAVGVPEHHARRLLLEVEEVHLPGQLAVIALLRLLETLEVGLELLLVGPGGAVDAGQHRLGGVTTPVGAGQLGQLERLQVPGVGHVGPPAHVGVLFVVIEAIEKRMKQLIDQDYDVVREYVDRDRAMLTFLHRDEPYKQEIVREIPEGESIRLYHHEEYTDMCRGPHVPNTRHLKAFKLTKLAGAYWRGDATKPMLTRIYGTAWPDKKQLKAYLKRLEEAEKRDHRKLARKMDLFHLQEEAPGMVFWHPNGWTMYQALEQYMRRVQIENGYQEIKTPQVVDLSLWKKSGHWGHYSDLMFTTESEKRDFAVKPMNCPCHVQVFNQGLKSYRDLPLRLAEFGSCHRNEPSGSLHGIMRVRGFTQDDAHIFCTEEQIQEEVSDFIDFLHRVYEDFGFEEVIYRLSTRPEQRVGSDESWDKAEQALAEALNAKGLDWEELPGEGAFYGPKIEFSLKD